MTVYFQSEAHPDQRIVEMARLDMATINSTPRFMLTSR